jgi:class 3 adenylate cyclase/putative methionine-R-sulfoxide reductase with GAF domain
VRSGTTSDLGRRATQPLGDTGVLQEHQTTDELFVQVDKLLIDNELLASRFHSISDVAAAVNSSLVLEDILDLVIEKAHSGFGFDYCAIGRVSAQGDAYELRALVWPENKGESPPDQRYGIREGLAASVIHSRKPIAVQDLTERPLKVRPPRFVGLLHPEIEGRLADAGIRSMLVAPLVAHGRATGFLSFGKYEPKYYSHDDMQLAYLFGNLLAAATVNAQRYDTEVRRARQLQMLSEIGETASSILDPATLLSTIPPLIQAYFGYDVAKIGLVTDDEVVYPSTAQAISGSPHPTDVHLSLTRNGVPEGIVGVAVSRRQMVLVRNVFEDERWADVVDSLSGPYIRSVLVIPMVARDRVMGVLHFESEQVDAFGKADVSILHSLSSHLGVSLDNARLYQQLNDLFHGYIAPQVASTLLDNPSNAELGGARREVTVLFADLDNFTTLAEETPPEELLDLLNACLGIATEAILEWGGTIDKYMGDAVMALFNAPQDQPDHAWRALNAATTMQVRLRDLVAGWRQRLLFSIGINTGEAVVGNIGSTSLRNYTAIGDTVNLAKRIQESAEPGQILVGQSTYEAALNTAPTGEDGHDPGTFVAYPVGTRAIRGRSKPAVLFEIDPYLVPFKTLPLRPTPRQSDPLAPPRDLA